MLNLKTFKMAMKEKNEKRSSGKKDPSEPVLWLVLAAGRGSPRRLQTSPCLSVLSDALPKGYRADCCCVSVSAGRVKTVDFFRVPRCFSLLPHLTSRTPGR